jgi:Icc protein
MTDLSGEATLSTASVSRVIQLSDTHLMSDPGGTLVGIDTDRSLAAVCRLISRQPGIDALLLTGDLAGDEAESAYIRLRDRLATLDVPSFWLPGNHDAPAWENTIFDRHFRRHIRCPHWDILMLNTQRPGEVAGCLSEAELTFLNAAAERSRATQRPLLVATHHPLAAVGCQWLDAQVVRNGAQALSILAPLGKKAVVISGHVHQDSSQVHEGVSCFTVPSTCVQFAPGSQQFKVDDQPPGCRLLELYEDGRLETQILRVVDESFPVDHLSTGYA